MALSTADIAYDLNDLLGEDVELVTLGVRTNVPEDTVIDTVGNKIRVGPSGGKVDSGTGSVEVWTPGTGSNPPSWQTSFDFTFYTFVTGPNGNYVRQRKTKTFGPFTITADANLADLVQEQDVPAERVAQVTETFDAYLEQGQALLAAQIATSELDDPTDLAETLIAELFAAYGPLVYRGTWNASTNVPNLADGVGTAGHFYQVAAANVRNLGSGNITFSVGDFVSYDGAVWTRTANPSGVNPVTGTEAGMRVVRGIINTAGSGSIVKGSGFSVVRNSTGAVTVTFDDPFSDIPVVTFATKGNGGAFGPIALHHNAFTQTAAAFATEIQSIGTGLVDAVFQFTAIGPR